MMSLMIDAFKNQDIATADITGAYLNTVPEELVIMRLTGEDVTLMCDVNPEFSQYIPPKTAAKLYI